MSVLACLYVFGCRFSHRRWILNGKAGKLKCNCCEENQRSGSIIWCSPISNYSIRRYPALWKWPRLTRLTSRSSVHTMWVTRLALACLPPSTSSSCQMRKRWSGFVCVRSSEKNLFLLLKYLQKYLLQLTTASCTWVLKETQNYYHSFIPPWVASPSPWHWGEGGDGIPCVGPAEEHLLAASFFHSDHTGLYCLLLISLFSCWSDLKVGGNGSAFLFLLYVFLWPHSSTSPVTMNHYILKTTIHTLEIWTRDGTWSKLFDSAPERNKKKWTNIRYVFC